MPASSSVYVVRGEDGALEPGPALYPVYRLAEISGGRRPICWVCAATIENAERVLLRGSLALCAGCAFEEAPDEAARSGVVAVGLSDLAASLLVSVESAVDFAGREGGRVLQMLAGYFEPDEGPDGAIEGLKRLAEASKSDWLAQCGGSHERMLEVCLGEFARDLAREVDARDEEVLGALTADPQVTLSFIAEAVAADGSRPFAKLRAMVRTWFASETDPPVEQPLDADPLSPRASSERGRGPTVGSSSGKP